MVRPLKDHGDAAPVGQDARTIEVTASDFAFSLTPSTWRLRIDESGTYTAYCSEEGHRESGMEATVVVPE